MADDTVGNQSTVQALFGHVVQQMESHVRCSGSSGSTFCVLKEHQPLNLYFLPLLHFNLLTSCVCHL